MEGDSCSRKSEGGDCRSGENEDIKVTWEEAHNHCKNAGMRLCNSQAELDQCCGTGCLYDYQLVWSSLKEGMPFITVLCALCADGLNYYFLDKSINILMLLYFLF